MYIEIDKKEAIRKAIFNSKENSVIVISGRGNKRKFIINNKEYLYSDKEIMWVCTTIGGFGGPVGATN